VNFLCSEIRANTICRRNSTSSSPLLAEALHAVSEIGANSPLHTADQVADPLAGVSHLVDDIVSKVECVKVSLGWGRRYKKELIGSCEVSVGKSLG